MNAVVKENLERYLSGALDPAEQRAIEAHLGVCDSCRREAREFEEVSQLFDSLRQEVAWEPAPGFYSSVMARVRERQERKPAPWFAGFFSFNLAFGRRLALASAMTLAVLGGYLVTHETRADQGPFPVALIAEQDSPSYDSAPAPEAMLATLTAYVR